MKITSKKLISLSLIALVFVSTSTMADLQSGVAFGLATLGSVALYMGLAAAAPIAIAGGVAIGAVAGLIYLSPDATPITEASKAPLVIQLDPSQPLTTPSGWTSPTQPPSSATAQTVTTFTYNSATFTNIGDFCNAFWADQGPAIKHNFPDASLGTPSGTSCVYYLTAGNTNVQYYSASGATTTTSCPTGYSVSGTNCTLTNPASVKKPVMGQQSIQRSGNSFSIDPQINPADINNKINVSGNTVSGTASDGSSFSVTLNTDGTSTAVIKTPTSDGNTTVKTINYGTPTGSGVPVTGTSSQTVQGQGTATTTTPVTGGTSSGGSFNCPECAKEVTLSNIKAILEGANSGADTAGSGMASHFDASQDATNTANKNTLTNFIDNSGILQAYQDKVLPLSPWNQAVNGESSNCQFPFVFMGATYEISICEAQPFIHTALSFVLFIITAFGVLALVTERPEGAD